jgi:histidinol phosphatase-like PHP family hydrolase
LRQAFRRAARAAIFWPEEAAQIIATGRSLTDLPGVGPFLSQKITDWFANPPKRVTPSELRAEFITMAHARNVVAAHGELRGQLHGDLQMHTVWSDGSGTIKEMADAALTCGYTFIAITDHTRGLKIANGLDERRLAAQMREIDEVNHALRDTKLQVLKSAEVNLSSEGIPDMPGETLARLDLVLGSFHSALRRTDDQTARYLAALRDPNIHILGHPQGRVFNYRAGLTADWRRVFAEAARLDKAVEIDAYADRQDLKLSLLRIARDEGVRISFGTDAHHPWQLAFIDLAFAAAIEARIPSERILNFMTREQLLAWARAHRDRGRPG